MNKKIAIVIGAAAALLTVNTAQAGATLKGSAFKVAGVAETQRSFIENDIQAARHHHQRFGNHKYYYR